MNHIASFMLLIVSIRFLIRRKRNIRIHSRFSIFEYCSFAVSLFLRCFFLFFSHPSPFFLLLVFLLIMICRVTSLCKILLLFIEYLPTTFLFLFLSIHPRSHSSFFSSIFIIISFFFVHSTSI